MTRWQCPACSHQHRAPDGPAPACPACGSPTVRFRLPVGTRLMMRNGYIFDFVRSATHAGVWSITRDGKIVAFARSWHDARGRVARGELLGED